MPKKWRKEKPVNSGKSVKPSPVQGNDLDLDLPGALEVATPDVYLNGEAQRTQQADSAVWAQEHLGNALTKGLAEGLEHISSPTLNINGGQPLKEPVRSEMESAFDRDFSGVRIHNDGAADKAAETLHARAFTTGKDIYFRTGEYNAYTIEGKQLLGHELAHVAQQGEENGINPVAVTQPDSKAETEANNASASIGAGKDVQIMPHPELAGAIARGIDHMSLPGAERQRQEAIDVRLRERSQLYSEFSREVLHRIRISQEFLWLEIPDYRMASNHMDWVNNYCLDALRRCEEQPAERTPEPPESSFFQPEQTFGSVMSQLPQWPASLLEGLRSLSELVLEFTNTISLLVTNPQSRTEEANSQASLELAEVYRQARDLWLRIQTQP